MRTVVLMGGVSSERAISLVSGHAVARVLAERGHEVLALDTRDGPVAVGELAPPIPAAGSAAEPAAGSGKQEKVRRRPAGAGEALFRWLAGGGPAGHGPEEAELAFIALHGGAGEDGTVQALLEAVGLPYTGSGVLGSAVALHKGVSKRLFRDGGVATPEGVTFALDGVGGTAEALRLAEEVAAYPLVVKPATEGSTVGVTIAGSREEMPAALRLAASHSREVLVERYIPGRELTVGILGERALPVVEIVPEGGFYDFTAKYTGGKSRYLVPASLPGEVTARLQEQALRAHRVLGAEGFSRVDFRLSPENEAYCLEINTVPGMTPTSLLPKAARAAGLEFGELVEAIARLGLEARRGG